MPASLGLIEVASPFYRRSKGKKAIWDMGCSFERDVVVVGLGCTTFLVGLPPSSRQNQKDRQQNKRQDKVSGALNEVLDGEVARREEGEHLEPSDHVENTRTVSAEWQVGQ